MAWFRLGGAGISAALKNAMNAVLNKKLGTSQVYDPNEWPEEVNLLGALEEKTVSSSPIVTFSDGADAVPLKKCEITLPASLDGYSEVDVVSAGKNLLDISTAQGTGTIWFHYDNGIKLKKGATYTFSCGNYGSGSISFYGLDHTTQISYAYISASSAKVTYTPTEDVVVCPRIYKSGLTVSGLIDVILEVGSDATEYEPYTAPTTHTADLGRTIYGGTANVVSGTAEPFNIVSLNRSPLREKNENGITINQQTENVLNVTTTGTAYACERLFYSLVAGTYTVKFLSTSSDSFTPIVSIYRAGGTGIALSINPNTERTFTLSEDTDIDIRLFASGSGDTTIRTVEFTDFQLEKGSTVHGYSPYFDPFTFDPVPIDSKLGNNTLWSEQGSAEVTYRGQGTTTPILPTLVTKTITENGTYSAEDDDADGYSEVTVNVETIPKLTVHEGELNISNGTITTSSTYCYTEPFDCPNGTIVFDCGEQTSAVNVGLELINADNSHANYFTCASRYREVDISQYYSATKKARLAFKKANLSKVLLMDFGNSKIYSALAATQFEETQSSLLSMNSTESEGSEGENEEFN